MKIVDLLETRLYDLAGGSNVLALLAVIMTPLL